MLFHLLVMSLWYIVKMSSKVGVAMLLGKSPTLTPARSVGRCRSAQKSTGAGNLEMGMGLDSGQWLGSGWSGTLGLGTAGSPSGKVAEASREPDMFMKKQYVSCFLGEF